LDVANVLDETNEWREEWAQVILELIWDYDKDLANPNVEEEAEEEEDDNNENVDGVEDENEGETEEVEEIEEIPSPKRSKRSNRIIIPPTHMPVLVNKTNVPLRCTRRWVAYV
jgi:hypothetical protein